ncbi:MAG: 4'-phosphopantetheinyl transferase family protein [Candidatus Sulfotelmatobacter sp.]
MQMYLLEQREQDVPESNDWLGARERDHVRTLNFLKRRADWRLGRWAAKCAIASLQSIPLHADLLATIQICPAASGQPEVFLHGSPADVTISISHRSGLAICALVANSVRLGCDLEIVEPHSAAFVADYFTPEEQELIERAATTDRWRLVAMLWSAKESALKALHEGLRRDTRSVVVKPATLSCGEAWSSIEVHSIEGECFHGWWRERSGEVQAVVADASFSPPIQLQSPKCADHESAIDAA